MSTAAPHATPAAASAADWLSSLDDVLGPDDGSDLPLEVRYRPRDAMVWTETPPERTAAPDEVGAIIARRLGLPVVVVDEACTGTVAAFRALAVTVRNAVPALTRLGRAMRAMIPPPPSPPSRLERSRQQRIASTLRRRDRRAARHRKHPGCRP